MKVCIPDITSCLTLAFNTPCKDNIENEIASSDERILLNEVYYAFKMRLMNSYYHIRILCETSAYDGLSPKQIEAQLKTKLNQHSPSQIEMISDIIYEYSNSNATERRSIENQFKKLMHRHPEQSFEKIRKQFTFSNRNDLWHEEYDTLLNLFKKDFSASNLDDNDRRTISQAFAVNNESFADMTTNLLTMKKSFTFLECDFMKRANLFIKIYSKRGEECVES